MLLCNNLGSFSPCIVSDAFSNDIGFCLKMTFPFLNSEMGFLLAGGTVTRRVITRRDGKG